jgi:transcriptional regulator with GAF, ATPase, and Fis domain
MKRELFQNKISLNETIEAVEKELIVQALKKSGGIQIQAAKLLGIKHKNLWHKIRKHKIARDDLSI